MHKCNIFYLFGSLCTFIWLGHFVREHLILESLCLVFLGWYIFQRGNSSILLPTDYRRDCQLLRKQRDYIKWEEKKDAGHFTQVTYFSLLSLNDNIILPVIWAKNLRTKNLLKYYFFIIHKYKVIATSYLRTILKDICWKDQRVRAPWKNV